MEVLFVIDPVDIPDLTIEWQGELPQVGDKIDITYYVEDEKYEEWYKHIIQESAEISNVERMFLGKSMGHLLDSSTIVVKSRTWVGKEHGCMLNCEIIKHRPSIVFKIKKLYSNYKNKLWKSLL